MNLFQYFYGEKHGAKKSLAKKIGISQTWLGLLIKGERTAGGKRASPLLAKKIEKATNGLVTAKELRPDIFN